MKKVTARVFKARCLSLMNEVIINGETIVITKRGKPVARLIPVGRNDIFGFSRGQGFIKGDIISPALTLAEWGELN